MGLWNRLVENIASSYAFFPPKPASYDYTVDDDKRVFIESHFQSVRRLNREAEFHFISTPVVRDGGGQQIFAVWIPCSVRSPQRPPTRRAILYSHANAIDIGQALPFFKALSEDLRINILAYDYSGYGVSTGVPSVSNSLADAEAALDFLCRHYNLREEDVIVYGQSVGSGPTVHLGANHPRLAGVVLHSPLMSGIRVLSPGVRCWPRCADVYPNLHLIRHVAPPTLLLHGTDDDVIHIKHGKELYRRAKNPYPNPLWAEGFGHHNLEICRAYVPRLQQFLAHVFPGDYTGRTTAPEASVVMERFAACAGRGSGQQKTPAVT